MFAAHAPTRHLADSRLGTVHTPRPAAGKAMVRVRAAEVAPHGS